MNVCIVDDEELSMKYIAAVGGVVAIILITIIIILICYIVMYRRKEGTYIHVHMYSTTQLQLHTCVILHAWYIASKFCM